MTDSIEGVVKSWLIDPSWQKVFKHTFDVFQDYISYILVTTGAVSLSVRLLNTLGSGDIMCVIVGIEYNKTTRHGTLDPYPSGGGSFMVNFAQHNERCIQTVLNTFMIYMPFILLLQVFSLILTEKISFRIPRLAQNVERFYQNLVEDSLFGKDPDVAEDMRDPRASTEGITRKRQRNEICVSLKRSSMIYNVYLGKKCLEIFLAFIFILLDIGYAMISSDIEKVHCRIKIPPFPGLLEYPGRIFYQCQAKKMSFYIMALRVHIALLILYGICAAGSILWCLFFRSVTGLIRNIQIMKDPGKQSSKLKKKLVSTMEGGKDFLFLFDLLSHTCGLESTLRVLTHSDETFYLICKPKLDPKTCLVLEEDKMKVVWSAADIEVWLQTGRQSRRQKHITVDSYEVTIFPAESVKNTHTVPSMEKRACSVGRPSIFYPGATAMPRPASSVDIEAKAMTSSLTEVVPAKRVYSTWFMDLNGGRTEYVITIACMIGKSRMKGEKIVTNLVPYGPEKPRSGMVKTVGTKQVEIFWDPPKGEFTKYILNVDHLEGKDFGKRSGGDRHDRRPSSPTGPSRSESPIMRLDVDNTSRHSELKLSYKLTTYTILGLDSGECYKMTLGTQTGNVNTRNTINDTVLTMPSVIKGFRAGSVTSSSCLLTWLLPEEGHACLKAFQINVLTHDGKIFKEVAVPRTATSFTLLGLSPNQDYEVSIAAVCVYSYQRTESEKAFVSLTTLPDRVRNLQLESCTPSSLTVKWDAPLVAQNARFQLTISAVTSKSLKRDADFLCSSSNVSLPTNATDEDEVSQLNDFETAIEVSGCERTSHTFGKLPDIVGSGFPYLIQIRVAVTSPKEVEVVSDFISETFYTRPLPPSGLHLVSCGDGWKIGWMPSLTPYVTQYKIRWKPLNNEDLTASGCNLITSGDDVVQQGIGNKESVTYTFHPSSFRIGSAYKVNVHSMVTTLTGFNVESKELHQKIEVRSEKELAVYIPDERISVLSAYTGLN